MGRPTKRDIYAEFILRNLGVITRNQMALAIGVTQCTITRWLNRMGVFCRPRKIIPEKQDCYFKKTQRPKLRSKWRPI